MKEAGEDTWLTGRWHLLYVQGAAGKPARHHNEKRSPEWGRANTAAERLAVIRLRCFYLECYQFTFHITNPAQLYWQPVNINRSV